MITHIHTAARTGKAVSHATMVQLCGHLSDGANVAQHPRDCLSPVDLLLDETGSNASGVCLVLRT
ncbi:endoribonuclease-like protein [Roseobacter litoralis Och 149]|uniref:Endoribonuclease-like protein n=1 Tax=Roseobacter litoralis (strain ATCC 49566 / DSM 6996 / JCM 21268 / NBRC 15278 / OCh 149) TaxID=391595 RepID=F7ZLA5_ROSLO|nr:endoribonuclease-like protein [Roseobacter litoralis Och 149]